MSAGVGFEWDARVVLGRPIGFIEISKEIKDLIERVWTKFNRSPFDTYNKKEDKPPPPKDWQVKLEELINAQVMGKVAKMEAESDKEDKGR